MTDLTDTDVPESALQFPVVCVGASAGGLEAFTQLLQALPMDTGMAFVLVSHLSPAHESYLADILARATRLPVSEVHDEPTVQPNRVYVIPPDRSMVISHGSLKLLPRRLARGQHHPIDLFMQSLATDQRRKAIGIILSGTATDGTVGVGEIKAQGGITFAQDETAQYDGMPHSAIMAGSVDFVLPPAGIATELVRMAQHAYVAGEVPDTPPQAEQAHISTILRLLNQGMGVDFTHYKANTLYRRITRRMALHKLESLEGYVRLLREEPKEVRALYHDILINVTSFFRNPEAFEVLKNQVFPRLTQDRRRGDVVRIWVLGCSTGEEAYSIAITLAEYLEQAGQSFPVQIFATDLNGDSIDKARMGLYSRSIAEQVSPERLRRFFQETDGHYRVSKSIREMCVFARHNGLADPPFSRVDLISCRNLLIYLEPVMQHRLMPVLHYSLKPNGILWLGTSETTGAFRELFEVDEGRQKFYSRKPAATRLPTPLPGVDVVVPDRPAVQMPPPPPERFSTDTQREADRILLSRFPPPGVLVTAEFEILQFRGETSPYLAPAAGKASLNLLKMLREGLLVGVRSALGRARNQDTPVRKTGLRVKSEGGYRTVDLEVIPVKGRSARDDCYLVLFGRPENGHLRRGQRDKQETPRGDAGTVREAKRLNEELSATREYLQSVIEQQEAAYEELQSANEEVQSANEELQSINEELETSKEEIQSNNEELATVNDELNTRNAELGQSNNDLLNLLASVQLAIIMLGPDLRIRRFTPQAERMANLIPSDLGRSIGDIKMNIDAPDLDSLVQTVIDTVSPIQREVQDTEGHWFSLRIRPYKTLDNRIDGAVLVLVDVDELKEAEESLRRSEERFRIVYDQAPLGIFETDLQGRFVRVNERFCTLVGKAADQLLGRRSEDLTHPDDRAADVEGFRRIGSGEASSLRMQKRYLHENGDEVWVEVHRFAVSDPQGRPRFTVGVVEAIGERRRNEEALRQSELRFRVLADTAPVLIWQHSLEGCEFVNRAYVNFLGVSQAEIRGYGWARFLHPDDRTSTLAAFALAAERLEPLEHQFRFLRADGEYRWMLTAALPRFGPGGTLAGYVGSTVDITEVKRAEESLREADRRKNHFIAMLAHELRNPLAPLRNITQLLTTPDLAPQTLVWAHEVLERQLRNIGRMVDDLLDVSRITQDKIRLQREPVEIKTVVDRVMETMKDVLESGGKHLSIKLPSEPLVLDVDPVRVEQILGNLLSNAAKFTSRGGHISLIAGLTHRAPRQAEIRIRDDGQGIAWDLLPRIFDMFTQADVSLERSHGGLGIGLTLVRKLVELHGGTVEAFSDGPASGAEFVVRLPLANAEAPDEEIGSQGLANGEVNGPFRILVVDDHVDAAEVIAVLLRRAGHEVALAHTGVSALEEQRQFRPDVILLDLGLPGMNGFEVAQRLRRDHPDDGPLLFAVSGFADDEARSRARDAGFDDYLAKPYDFPTLQQLLRRRNGV